MDEKGKSRQLAEVFVQLDDENKTRLEDIALGMRIQREISQKAGKTKEAEEKEPAAVG